jgi:hypothetical protein
MTQEEKRGDMKSRNEIPEKKFICARSFIAPRTSLPFGHAHFCREEEPSVKRSLRPGGGPHWKEKGTSGIVDGDFCL